MTPLVCKYCRLSTLVDRILTLIRQESVQYNKDKPLALIYIFHGEIQKHRDRYIFFKFTEPTLLKINSSTLKKLNNCSFCNIYLNLKVLWIILNWLMGKNVKYAVVTIHWLQKKSNYVDMQKKYSSIQNFFNFHKISILLKYFPRLRASGGELS